MIGTSQGKIFLTGEGINCESIGAKYSLMCVYLVDFSLKIKRC